MDSRKFLHPIGLAVCVAVMATPLTAEARIKCWTNEQGNKECGDKVPPKYSQGGHKVLDSQGMTVGETGAAPSEEELKAKKEMELKMEQERLAKEKREHEDRVLLDTFPEESDIIRSRDSKLVTIEGQISLEKEKIKKLEQQLAAAKERKQRYLDQEQEVPQVLQDGIDGYARQLEDAKQYIEQSGKDKESITMEYNGYLQRHREIRGFTGNTTEQQ